jgi:hypothetical protein
MRDGSHKAGADLSQTHHPADCQQKLLFGKNLPEVGISSI